MAAVAVIEVAAGMTLRAVVVAAGDSEVMTAQVLCPVAEYVSAPHGG